MGDVQARCRRDTLTWQDAAHLALHLPTERRCLLSRERGQPQVAATARKKVKDVVLHVGMLVLDGAAEDDDVNGDERLDCGKRT